jgi:Flp pilus assembly protein TadB
MSGEHARNSTRLTRYRSGRAMSSHHSLRASDADRDAVVDRLREAAGEGRLEPDELEQRVDGALRARTYGDLAELLADLPVDGRMPSPRARWRTDPLARSAVFGAGLLVAVIAAFAVVVVVAMLVLATAALWICLVLCWLVCRGLRRRQVWGPAGRRSVSARHAHRVRPTGSL